MGAENTVVLDKRELRQALHTMVNVLDWKAPPPEWFSEEPDRSPTCYDCWLEYIVGVADGND